MQDEQHEIDHLFRPPEPFDRAIANLDVRSVSNSSVGGLDLQLTASFGVEEAEVPVDDGTSLLVKFEIFEASVKLQAFNCSVGYIKEERPVGGYEYEQTLKTNLSDSSMVSGGASAKAAVNAKYGPIEVAGGGNGQAKIETEDSLEFSTTAQKKARQVEFLEDYVKIQPNPDGRPLIGVLIDHAICFRLLPIEKEKPFGVLATLDVRRGWLKLSNPDPDSLPTKIKKLWNDVSSGQSAEDRFHKEAFLALIHHLVLSGLQAKSQRNYVTFAAQSLRAIPKADGDIEQLRLPALSRQFEIPVSDLEMALVGNVYQVANILRRHSVQLESSPNGAELSALMPSVFQVSSDPIGSKEARVSSIGKIIETYFNSSRLPTHVEVAILSKTPHSEGMTESATEALLVHYPESTVQNFQSLRTAYEEIVKDTSNSLNIRVLIEPYRMTVTVSNEDLGTVQIADLHGKLKKYYDVLGQRVD